MKLVVFIVAFLMVNAVSAQIKITIKGKDTIINVLALTNQQASIVYVDKMPNSLQNFKDNQQLQSNNQQGFDVYQSQIDNMAVLKPDVANLASLKGRNVVITNDNAVEINRPNEIKIFPKPNNDTKLLKPKKFKLDNLPLSPQ